MIWPPDVPPKISISGVTQLLLMDIFLTVFSSGKFAKKIKCRTVVSSHIFEAFQGPPVMTWMYVYEKVFIFNVCIPYPASLCHNDDVDAWRDVLPISIFGARCSRSSSFSAFSRTCDKKRLSRFGRHLCYTASWLSFRMIFSVTLTYIRYKSLSKAF